MSVQGAQEVEVGLGAQAVRLCKRRVVAELVGGLYVQQRVRSIGLLLRMRPHLCRRQANNAHGHGQGVKLRKRTRYARVSQVGKVARCE